MTSRPKIAMPLWNGFQNDARVLKEAQTLQAAGYDVTIFALRPDPLTPHLTQMASGLRVRRFSKGGHSTPAGFAVKTTVRRLARIGVILRRLMTQIHILLALIWARPDVIHAHDINTLPMGFLAARLCGARIVYDAHEFALGRAGYGHLRRLIALLERCIVPRVDGMISTSPSNAKAYARLYGIIRPTVLRNMPVLDPNMHPLPRTDMLRTALSVPADMPIILYQGGLQEGRGLPMLIEAMAHVPHAHCVLMGDGRLCASLTAQVQNLGITDRVHFQPAVPLDQLLHYTASADIGVHPLDDSCLNHLWASPNKIHEYIHAGLPVIATDLPELRAIVSGYGVGQLFSAGDVTGLAQQLRSLSQDSALRDTYRTACHSAAASLSWQTQIAALLGLYATLTQAP